MVAARDPVNRPPRAGPESVSARAGSAASARTRASGRPSLEAVVADPLTEPAPAGWDEFVAAQRLRPVWRSSLVRAVDWCAVSPSSMVLVREAASGQPVAVFHARHAGPTRPGRFHRPGRAPRLGLTACLISPAVTQGYAFAAALDRSDRTEACRTFEQAVLRRTGWGHLAVAYRHLYDQDLSVVPTSRRVRLQQATHMVIDNAWPDFESYLASLPRKWRSQLRRIQRTIREAGLRVEIVDAVEPDEVSWLVEVVRARYRTGGIRRPPWPARLFAELGRSGAGRFLTYRTGAGRLVGSTVFIDDGEELVMMLWGTRSDRDGGHRDLYFDQYLRMMDLMIRTGRARVQLGYGMNAIKERFGARPQRRWTVAGLR